MSFTYVGRIYDLAFSPGSAKWKLRIRCTNPQTKVFVRLKTTDTKILDQLADIQDDALIAVSATLSPSSAPGEPYTGTAPGMVWTPRPGFTVLTFPGVPSEPYTVTRLTVLSTTPTEP